MPYEKNPLYPRVMIYDVLKSLGYRTALISSQNETWGNLLHYLDTGGLDYILHSETFEGPTYVPRDNPGFLEFVKGTKRAGKIDDRFTVNKAIEWVDDETKPFFIYMNLQNSHVPYEVPADHERRFSKPGETYRFTFARLTPDQLPIAKRLYSESLGYVDAQLGRLIDHLKKTGAWDRTVMVVTGDTGQAFMEHGFFSHSRDLFNEVMRVPIIVRAPGMKPRIDDRLAQHVDVPPSLFSLMGLPLHPSFQGQDLFGEESSDRSVYMAVRTPMAHQYAVVRNDLKLIFDVHRNRTRLYDLARDPGERHEISRQRPLATEKLSERLGSWRRLQMGYYANVQRQKREYPPTLLD